MRTTLRPLALTLLAATQVAIALGAPLAAEAQPLDFFDVQRFTPAPGPGNYLQTEGLSRLRGHMLPGAGLTLDYAHQPFALFDVDCTGPNQTDCEVGDVSSELVSFIASAHLYGSLVLAERFQLALNLPLLFSDGDGFQRTFDGGRLDIPGGSRFVLGDPTVSFKARLYERRGFYLGASVFAQLPVGQQIADDAFLGDGSVRAGGQVIVELIKSGFRFALNAGGHYRDTQTFLSTQVGPAITYRAAIGYDVPPLVTVFVEADGASGLSGELDENPLEARLAGRLRQGDFESTAAIGAGVLSGAGVPVVRGLIGGGWLPSFGDEDSDGVLDENDACPTELEDQDNWEDDDGCPDPDNDEDGLPDVDDPCPDAPEDRDGFEDEDGCPEYDNDQDGVRDGFDSCPEAAEDMDGDRDNDGCPDDDTDRDGVEDADDLCPEVPEDIDGLADTDGCPERDADDDGIDDFADECPEEPELINGFRDRDGCPEPDQDGDGIADARDRCAARAETINGRSDEDGCPDGRAIYSLGESEVLQGEPLLFRRGQATPRTRTTALLRMLATLLKLNPTTHVRVVAAAETTELAGARAEFIKAELVRRGIAAHRLSEELQQGQEGFTLALVEPAQDRSAIPEPPPDYDPTPPGAEEPIEGEETGDGIEFTFDDEEGEGDGEAPAPEGDGDGGYEFTFDEDE